MPIASTRPNSERLFSEKPKAASTAKVPISDTGMATIGMTEARQLVLHLQCRVIRDVELVARRVRRAQVDHHQHVGRVLLHDDTEPLYLLGELRLRDSDAVLNENLCDIEIGAEGEGDRELQIAVRGRLAAHVEHVLDAVDLLLERGCDGIADDLRRAPGYVALTTMVGGAISGYCATCNVK